MQQVDIEAEGEVRKGALGCGGVDGQVADGITTAWKKLSASEKAGLPLGPLETVTASLGSYGCIPIEDVLTMCKEDRGEGSDEGSE